MAEFDDAGSRLATNMVWQIADVIAAAGSNNE
jgi:hypothetical protein